MPRQRRIGSPMILSTRAVETAQVAQARDLRELVDVVEHVQHLGVVATVSSTIGYSGKSRAIAPWNTSHSASCQKSSATKKPPRSRYSHRSTAISLVAEVPEARLRRIGRREFEQAAVAQIDSDVLAGVDPCEPADRPREVNVCCGRVLVANRPRPEPRRYKRRSRRDLAGRSSARNRTAPAAYVGIVALFVRLATRASRCRRSRRALRAGVADEVPTRQPWLRGHSAETLPDRPALASAPARPWRRALGTTGYGMTNPSHLRGKPEIDPKLPRYESLVHMLLAAVDAHPEVTAVIYEDRRITYAEFGRAVGGSRAAARRGRARPRRTRGPDDGELDRDGRRADGRDGDGRAGRSRESVLDAARALEAARRHRRARADQRSASRRRRPRTSRASSRSRTASCSARAASRSTNGRATRRSRSIAKRCPASTISR